MDPDAARGFASGGLRRVRVEEIGAGAELRWRAELRRG
jgi:hypothetical protein